MLEYISLYIFIYTGLGSSNWLVKFSSKIIYEICIIDHELSLSHLLDTCTYIHTYIHTYIYVCMYVCMRVCVYVFQPG